MKVIETSIPNVFTLETDGRRFLVTRSRYPPHYGERKFNGFREWRLGRSKLGVLIERGIKIKIKDSWKVLYLGAASGTTLSHLADIVDNGIIYGVEYAPRPFIGLLRLARERKNVIPLLRDAGHPERYNGIVERVELIYQDIAQKNQIEIFEENARFFLKNGGYGIIMIKAKSIDSTADPERIYSSVLDRLENNFRIISSTDLEPYHRDHIAVELRHI